MKKALVLAIVLACALVFTAPAFAAPANPFADLPASHWAYEAVNDLYKAGVIVGNQGRFDGQKSVTRYEAAQMVYAAMKNASKANPDQKKVIDKLQAEFAAELKALGARVSKLEAAAGAKSPVIVMGQQRFTYAYRRDKANVPGLTTNAGLIPGTGLSVNRSQYVTYRTRLEWFVPLDKHFTYYGRLRAQDYDVTGGTASGSAGSFQSVRMEVHQLWITNPFNLQGSKVTIGRGGMFLGKAGFALAVGDHDFVTFEKKITKGLTYSTQYGNAYQSSAASAGNRWWNNQITWNVAKGFNIDLYNQKRLWPTGYATTVLGATNGQHGAGADFNVWSLGFDKKITKKISVFGEYAKNTRDINFAQATTGLWGAASADQKKNPQAYWIGITNGNASLHPGMAMLAPFNKVGADAWALIYKNIENGTVYSLDNQLNATLGNGAASGCLWLTDNVKGPEFYYQRTIGKNVSLLTQFGYKMKPIKSSIAGVSEYGSYGIAQLYIFF